MTAKDYLKRIGTMDKRINYKIQAREQLLSQVCRTTPVLTNMPKGKSDGGGFENAMARIIDMGQEIDDEIDQLVAEKKRTKEMIATLSSPIHRDILTLRYIDLKNATKVAMLIPCHRATVYRWENEAIALLEDEGGRSGGIAP